MAISPARIAAFDILLRVEHDNSYASELLHTSQYENLTSADHGLATELVMGVLRWRSLLDKYIAERSSLKLTRLDAEVLNALRLAAYQLLFLDRVPARAAVHESAELVKRARKRSAVPFANAVLRNFAGLARPDAESIARTETSSTLAQNSAHPLWLVERWIQDYGFDAARQACAYHQRIPDTVVTFSDPAVEKVFQNSGIHLSPGHMLTSAYSVIAGDLTATQAFRNGQVHIQDEASQLVSLLIGCGSSILDCCAAPGGKTRVIAQHNPNARVVATDLHAHRARTLRKLVTAGNVCVVAADARNLPLTMLFDRVLADVPCSGTGTLARNPEIKWTLRPEDLVDLQTRQLAILQSAMQRVSPGGRLVYATCSLEKEENFAVIEQAMSVDRSFRLRDCQIELQRIRESGMLRYEKIDSLTSGPFLRTIPGVHPCDGFFAAILQKV
jgi:16S rRNA (cytosine967-C5)-methyltransferase